MFMRDLFILMLLLCSCSTSTRVELLITNLKVVDVLNDTVYANQYVGISADTIVEVGHLDQLSLNADQILDAQGLYIMPGLWDMHVHFRGGEELISENKQLLNLFLAYGVTTVRDAGGDITPVVLDWKNKIDSGKLNGPKIFTSGPKLDGNKPAWKGSIKVISESDVIKALDSLEELGVDYVKTYDGSLTREAYYWIIEEAEKRGLKTTGHMPLSARIEEAMDLGLDGSEHMYYSLKSCSPLADSLTELGMGYSMIIPIVESYDSLLAAALFEKMARQNFFVTPTSFIGKTLDELAYADHSKDTLLTKIGDGIRKTYQRRIDRAIRSAEKGNSRYGKVEALSNTIIEPMFDAGVYILSGSDCGAFNSFVYPGESLHGELRSLVNLGLTPREALMTSIIYGPIFFGMEDDFGAVEEGKVADLILLKGNPLQNIEYANEISYIVRKSILYTPKDFLD